MSVFMDGDRVTPGTEGCKCTGACEFPCWQRLGMTSHPCCSGCAPLDDPSPVLPAKSKEME